MAIFEGDPSGSPNKNGMTVISDWNYNIQARDPLGIPHFFQHCNHVGTCPWWRALSCMNVTWNINDFVPPLGHHRTLIMTATAKLVDRHWLHYSWLIYSWLRSLFICRLFTFLCPNQYWPPVNHLSLISGRLHLFIYYVNQWIVGG